MDKPAINYLVEGEGETIVFIHGLSDNLNYWEVLANPLKNKYKILRFDLRGHGDSKLWGDEITVDSYTEDLNCLLDELNIDNVNLVGLSLGGVIALNFAIKYPSKVSSLVMMSSFSYCSNHLENELNKFKRAISNSPEEFFDTILPFTLCPDVIKRHEHNLGLLRNNVRVVLNVDAVKKAIDAILNFNVECMLDAIDIKTLILAGKYDDLSLLSEQTELSRNIKNSDLIVFDNLKHNLLVGKDIGKIVDILIKFYS